MGIDKRGLSLLLSSAAASLFLIGCASVPKSEPERVEAPVALAPAVPEPEPERETPEQEPVFAETEVEEEDSSERGSARALVRKSRPLRDQAARYGAKVEPMDEAGSWLVTDGERRLELKESSRIASLDGVKVFLDRPFVEENGRVSLGTSDARILLAGIFKESARTKASGPIRTIVIDPGHGGQEDGTKNQGLGLLEKELNLDVSQRLQAHLEKLGFKAVLTRYDDRVVSLDERPVIASGVKADLFVSVHFNAATNLEAKGLETYMLTPEGQPSSSGSTAEADAIAYSGNRFDAANFALAYGIQKSLVERLNREDRGVKKARFRVLKTLDCPGVLVECGFISNQEEALLVSTAGYRERVALALAEAIADYAKALEERS